MLRNMFFTILRHHAPKLASKLDVVYALSSAWTMSESSSDFDMLEQRLKDLSPDELVMVSLQGASSPQLYLVSRPDAEARLILAVPP